VLRDRVPVKPAVIEAALDLSRLTCLLGRIYGEPYEASKLVSAMAAASLHRDGDAVDCVACAVFRLNDASHVSRPRRNDKVSTTGRPPLKPEALP
jgi:hypothetical protein